MTTTDRRRKALERAAAHAEALLVTTPANVRYLTGFTGSNAQLLLGAEPAFYTDGRYDEQSATQVPDLERRIYGGTVKFTDQLSKDIADRGLTRIGVEADNLTLAQQQRLHKALDGIELVPTNEIVEGVRERKDAGEIDAIRRAQRVAEEAVASALAAFEGGTEIDLALAIEWGMRRGGAEAVSFETIVATGAHSALPHAEPRDVPVDRDGVLLIDFGAKVDGYCSDTTRTWLGPNAPEELRKVHDAVVRALEAACNAVEPGAKGSDVDAAARGVLEAEGYAEHFVHSTGHGVGLDVHEGPTLATTSESVLEPGMLVTVEPGVYLPGVGGVRVEDLLVVTESGYENLTTLTRDG
jgi:Xaa-Pro aminopeptidase